MNCQLKTYKVFTWLTILEDILEKHYKLQLVKMLSDVSAVTNIALNKSAWQRTTYESYTADKAVNGIRPQPYPNLDLAHNSVNTNGWWYVDLGKVHNLWAVLLYNRIDCCGKWCSSCKSSQKCCFWWEEWVTRVHARYCSIFFLARGVAEHLVT